MENIMEKTIVEINGIKMEIDLRQAKKIETYKVGDNVKVLIKEYNSYSSYPGVIIGFDDFASLPTISVCYLKTGYNAEVKFVFINADSKDIEIVHMTDADKMELNLAPEQLDREIMKKEAEIADLKAKKAYFLENFNRHLAPVQMHTDYHQFGQ
jgi:ribosomal protein L19